MLVYEFSSTPELKIEFSVLVLFGSSFFGFFDYFSQLGRVSLKIVAQLFESFQIFGQLSFLCEASLFIAAKL